MEHVGGGGGTGNESVMSRTTNERNYPLYQRNIFAGFAGKNLLEKVEPYILEFKCFIFQAKIVLWETVISITGSPRLVLVT